MFKRSSANYSLWPEQARPRRGMPLSLAAGGFAVGIICAIAVVNGASQFIRPVAMEAEPVETANTVQPIPVYSASSALVAGKAAASDDESAARSRARPVAKTALPMIGRAVPVISETDGRGGDPAVKMPPVRLTDDSGVPTATANATPKLIRNGAIEAPATSPDETKVAAHEPAAQAAEQQPEEAKPAPVKKRKAYRRSKPRRTYEARAPKHRPTYAAPYRAGPVYGYNGAPIRNYYYQY